MVVAAAAAALALTDALELLLLLLVLTTLLVALELPMVKSIQLLNVWSMDQASQVRRDGHAKGSLISGDTRCGGGVIDG